MTQRNWWVQPQGKVSLAHFDMRDNILLVLKGLKHILFRLDVVFPWTLDETFCMRCAAFPVDHDHCVEWLKAFIKNKQNSKAFR